MLFHTNIKFKSLIFFLIIANVTHATPLINVLQVTTESQVRSTLAKVYTSITTHLTAASTHSYFPHIVAGSIIALSGGYYWHQKQQQLLDNTPNYDPTEPRCEVPGMVGACPPEVGPIIEQLKENNKQFNIGLMTRRNKNVDNVILFEGPTGIGKTALARAIATATDSHFVEIYGSDVLSSFIGGSAQIINEKIGIAIAEGLAYEKLVIIFFDEIDAFASRGADSGARTEYDAAYKALWRHIDNNKNNPDVCFIFATNHLDRLPVELRNRVDYSIHMKNPDALQRKELLNHFCKQYAHKELNQFCSSDCIEKLIRGTKDFSVRNISNLCKHAHHNAFIKNEPINEKHILKELEKIKKEIVLQQKPHKEEQERELAAKINNENLMWNRINGFSTILNILSKIALFEIAY